MKVIDETNTRLNGSRRITKILLGVLAASALFAVTGLVLFRNKPTAREVMADFHEADGRAEDMLMDPLILNADTVAPVVIEEIKDPEMDKRRYAIGFLGNERIESAMPALREILADPSEKEEFRADALESIYRIDRKEGLMLARQYKGRDDFLGYVAGNLLTGTMPVHRRTYFQALVGHHE